MSDEIKAGDKMMLDGKECTVEAVTPDATRPTAIVSFHGHRMHNVPLADLKPAE